MTTKKIVKNLKDTLSGEISRKTIDIAIKELQDYGKPVKFNNNVFYILAISTLFLFAYGFFLDGFAFNIINLIAIVITFIVSIAIPLSRHDDIESIADKMFFIDALLDNNIKQSTVSISYFKKRYYGFTQGNYSNDIANTYIFNNFKGKEYSFDALLCNYHYVDSRIVTYPCGKSTCTRIEYEHYDRYCIEVAFTHTNDLVITTDNFFVNMKESYKTASINFNKGFSVYCNEQKVAAKLLKPALIVSMEDLSKEFTNVSLQFFDDKLCIMFNDNDVLPTGSKRIYGLDQPEEFVQELNGITELNKLNKILNFIEHLLRHTDNNFK